MKNTGACPKCQNTSILRVHRGTGDLIALGLRPVAVTRYVCFDCGFSEEWIESRNDLLRLRDKHGYQRDQPARPSGTTIEDDLGLS